MSHAQQLDFCYSIKKKFPSYFLDKFVLDIGSLDINGSNRGLFENCKYLGVDIGYGINVDIISKGHELNLPDETFDTIISTECFEHDMYYKDTIKNIIRLLKPGGLFFFTCATTGRPEHGTVRTSTEADAPFLKNDEDWANYYKNLTENDIRGIISIEDTFSEFGFSINDFSKDLYFYGIKKGEFFANPMYSHLQKKEMFFQIYIKVNNEYSESNSITLPFNFDGKYTVDLSSFKNVEFEYIRIDPLNLKTNVVIEKVFDDSGHVLVPINSNADIFKNNIYRFNHDDPSIEFKLNRKVSEINVELDYVSIYEL